MSRIKFKEMAPGMGHSFWNFFCWGRVGIVRSWVKKLRGHCKTFCCTQDHKNIKINYSSHIENEWILVNVEWVWDKISSWGVKCSNKIIITFFPSLIKFQTLEILNLWKEKKYHVHILKIIKPKGLELWDYQEPCSKGKTKI